MPTLPQSLSPWNFSGLLLYCVARSPGQCYSGAIAAFCLQGFVYTLLLLVSRLSSDTRKISKISSSSLPRPRQIKEEAELNKAWDLDAAKDAPTEGLQILRWKIMVPSTGSCHSSAAMSFTIACALSANILLSFLLSREKRRQYSKYLPTVLTRVPFYTVKELVFKAKLAIYFNTSDQHNTK
jgi:hypothetical protein